MNDVSIIMVTYNRPITLLSVIDSYINQQYINEIIVIDDGSTKSYEDFSKYCRNKCSERDILYIYHKNKENKGAAYARNVGLSFAHSRFVLWGEDDLYLDNNYVEMLHPYVNDMTAVFGAIYYDMSKDYSPEKKFKIIRDQQTAGIELMNWKTIEGYFRLHEDNPIKCLFGHAVYIAPRQKYDLIEIFNGYRVNGFREETDIQLQLGGKGVQFLYCGFVECYHLKERIGDEKYGGQHKDPRFIQEIYYVLNNNLFLNRNYKYIKEFKQDISPKIHLKLSFFVERISFLLKLLRKKISRVVHK